MPITLPVPGGGGATPPSQYYSNLMQLGEYQFISLTEIIENFMAAYVGGGKILQIVNVHDDQYATYSSTSVNAKVQVLTASITPSATSSKILITGFISMSSTGTNVQTYGVEILRGSTIIGSGEKASWQRASAAIT